MDRSEDPTTGGREPLPLRGPCAKCKRWFEVSAMQRHGNYRSAAYDKLVCGDCYQGDGPYVGDLEDIEPDDMSPPDGLLL